jgi:hypothetical protein
LTHRFSGTSRRKSERIFGRTTLVSQFMAGDSSLSQARCSDDLRRLYCRSRLDVIAGSPGKRARTGSCAGRQQKAF